MAPESTPSSTPSQDTDGVNKVVSNLLSAFAHQGFSQHSEDYKESGIAMLQVELCVFQFGGVLTL
eukprot:2312746-Amphidinium_carterae.1